MTLADHARRLKFTRPRGLPPAFLLTDETRLPDPAAVMMRLPAGTGVLLRLYGVADHLALAERIAAVARSRRLVLAVAADWRLAARLGAAVIHLPEGIGRSGRNAPLLDWARRRGVAVTMACHSPRAVAAARRLGADAALLSPVFATASHPGAAVIGAVRFRLWRARAGLPVYALGGIDARSLRRLNGGGFAAIAGWGA
ncbi:MAG TPA: thiamine phosphate synthase [Candidatus Omnitrophota bacterium]|nr:thiamine phosphate synthase [Candidatus Omnitrophota bacterium]